MSVDKKKRKRNFKTEWEREDARLEKKEDLFVVQELLDKKYKEEEKGFHYLVKWQGFPPSENTWEAEALLLEDVPEMVIDYNDRLDSLCKQASNYFD